MLLIGLDPGIKTGIAFFSNGDLVGLDTCAPWEVESHLNDVKRIVFEDSRLQSVVFNRGATSAATLKIARNVGEIDAWCKLIVALAEKHQIPSLGISPKHKGAKLDAEQFKMLTGWQGPTNQHERDAAMIACPYRKGFAR
jgi:hypothetical protein